MTQEPRHPGIDEHDGLPEPVERDLRSLYGTEAGPPSRVDEAVLGAAREHFGAMRMGRQGGGGGRLSLVVRRVALVGGPLAAAAILALVVWITPWGPGRSRSPLLRGTGRQQAQRTIEKELETEMMPDRLDFEESQREERLALGESMKMDDAARSAGAGAGGVAALADGKRKDARAAAEPAAPLAAAKARPAEREDFDRDGVVDMRDALAMALVLEQGAWTMGPEWDLNADGEVDSEDVEVVALAAVDLERHGEVIQ